MEKKINNDFKPRIIAIELTSQCNLLCKHCRGSSTLNNVKNELKKNELINLLDQLAYFGSPIVILTGGEPLLNPSVFDLIEYGSSIKLNMALATNATLITEDIAHKLKISGIKRVSISLDGTKAIHDSFRSINGCFDKALYGISCLKKENIEFQINTTISKHNLNQLEDIHKFVIDIGAVAHHLFFLVPTGRGNNLTNYELSSKEYEDILLWLYKKSENKNIHIHPTCAPHYLRIKIIQDKEKFKHNFKLSTHSSFDNLVKGCLGGSSFVFISSIGDVNPCGYLPLSAGNIKTSPFIDIWNNSEIFNNIRNPSKYKGKCGICKFKLVCGGCRARAFSVTGDYLEEEPFCSYNPINNI